METRETRRASGPNEPSITVNYRHRIEVAPPDPDPVVSFRERDISRGTITKAPGRDARFSRDSERMIDNRFTPREDFIIIIIIAIAVVIVRPSSFGTCNALPALTTSQCDKLNFP